MAVASYCAWLIKTPTFAKILFCKTILYLKLRHIAAFWLWMAALAIFVHGLVPHHHHFNAVNESVCNFTSQQNETCNHDIAKTGISHQCNEEKHHTDCKGCQFSVVSTDLKKIFKTNFLVSTETETITYNSASVSTKLFVKNTLLRPSRAVRIPQLRAPPVV